jgi:aspartyl-tRNA(Asn)/glutamyl-tRNA(Gln) amidotransferase subunit B
LIYISKVNNLTGRQILEEMFLTGKDPTSIMEEKNLGQIEDAGEIETIVEKIIAANPKAVEDFKAGKEASFKFLVGQVMREAKGKANPAMINKLLLEKLS